jgi:hypothetical protein
VSIQTIDGNTSLQLATKIQASLRAILTNCDRKLRELDVPARTVPNDIDALNSKCSQFVIDLSIAVLDKTPSTDRLLQIPFFERIVKAVVEIWQSLDHVKHERDRLKAFPSYFADVFQSAKPTQVTAIDEFEYLLDVAVTRMSAAFRWIHTCQSMIGRRRGHRRTMNNVSGCSFDWIF